MRNFNFKSATNTKEATKLASGRATFLPFAIILSHALTIAVPPTARDLDP